MADESRLNITIDSRMAEQLANQLTKALQRMEKAGDDAAASTERVSDSLEDERKGLAKLLGQINPTVAALDRLDDMQQKLQRYKKLGIVESDTLVDAQKRLDAMRYALGEADDGMNRTGMSAKQMANNLRMVPPQLTDIAVSLASGQAPMTVFLQQGGQLKDMFGGIGPAARAVGGYVLGLVTPFTLAAAAVGALTLAYYQGSEETDAMTDAVIENGNAAGTSANQLANFAAQVGKGNVTVGEAAAVLTQLAAAGNPLTILYTNITASTLSWSKMTGQATTEVVENFNDLAKNPVDAVKKLDDQLYFLTAAQYANIQSLQEQGRTMDAARVATEAYADALATRSAEMEQNLGYVESAWNGLKSAAKSAWDAMLDVGRTETPEQQLAKVYKQIENAQKGVGRGGRLMGLGINQDSLDTLYKRAEELQSKIAAEGQKQAEDIANNLLQTAGKKGVDTINSIYTSAQTQTQKLEKQLKDLDKARANALAAGGFTAEEETKYAASRKNIEQQIADIKEREAKKNAPKTRGQNAGVREADNTVSRLLAQYDPAAQAARTLTKEESQLQLALSKGKITREEYGKALAQASQNYAAAIKGAQGLTAAEQYQAQLERQLLLQREQYAAQAASVGMGSLEAERYQQRIQLEQQSNDRVLQLQTELAQATTEKQRQELQAQIDLEREYLPKRIQAQKEGYQQMDKARQDWLAGAASGARTWFEQIDDTASQTRSAMMRGLDGLNDELHTFVTTGKASFRSLTTSVLSDLARIAQNKFITSLISSMSGSSNGVVSAISSYFTANAKGGVYSSPSLSTFSNGIYNSPQFFAFAKGAGVFGEAGPEAIMPLTRAADGSLGVRALGGGGAQTVGGNSFEINTNVTVGTASTSQSVTSNTNDSYAMQLSKMIADVARGVVAQESQPGGIIWRMQNGR
ncbi:phage tail tape measure protein [Pseudomonas nitroreducens]|uniref:phage tail tape measure protein n=1 Tax=Pseudomonas nitroreducens TaxID=46680 RepID=UPI00244BD0FB|nr:phage tail tape measure protein [Pseudomonas nitroreducens]MDH1074599.1 phage tail tape measure protein [Pseudomonas nitroreducens]